MKGFKIARIFGIDIEIHWSWFIVFFLFTYGLATRIFPKLAPEQASIYYWLVGEATTLMLFISVLIHELAHSKVAQLYKISIHRITLLFFGGAAQMESVGRKAKEEFCIAIAGPISSIVMAGIFWVLDHFVKTDIKLLSASLGYLFIINLFLAIFNLLPAYPMDGGRVFKTILWAISKNELMSLKIATRVGQALGILMMIAGIFKLGFWFVLIGWFLFTMAPGEYRQLRIKKLLAPVKAREIMVSVPTAFITGDMKKEEFGETCDVEDGLDIVNKKMKDRKRFLIFVMENDVLVGMIYLNRLNEYIKSKM